MTIRFKIKKTASWYGKLTSKRKRMESSSSLCDLFPARQKTILFAINIQYETDSKIMLLLFNRSQRCCTWFIFLHLYLISKEKDASKLQCLSLDYEQGTSRVPDLQSIAIVLISKQTAIPTNISSTLRFVLWISDNISVEQTYA